MTPGQARRRQLYDVGRTIAEIARIVDLSRRTLYRHLQP
ncbi:helix-turn-helix domain-containing protein [Kribbella qitaiheensis]